MDAGEEIESYFPGLRGKDWRLTSQRDTQYNCIAWAACDSTQWWWPGDPADGYHWPAGVDRIETLEAFVAAYALLGYEACTDASAEVGFEKVAIFVDADGKPTHAARQLNGGRWTSKLGNLEDIEHDLQDVCGDLYGTVARIMERAHPQPAPVAQ